MKNVYKINTCTTKITAVVDKLTLYLNNPITPTLPIYQLLLQMYLMYLLQTQKTRQNVISISLNVLSSLLVSEYQSFLRFLCLISYVIITMFGDIKNFLTI